MCAAERSRILAGGFWTLAGCCLVTLALGSIHAYSVLIAPLEQRFGSDRGAISMVYSTALVSLTFAVMAGWRIYHRMAPARIVMIACGLGAFGLLVGALAPTYRWVLAGYGLLFGLANGLGYGFALQLSARAGTVRPATAMALVTACYALGATLFAFLLAHWQLRHGVSGALLRQAVVVALSGLVAGLIIRADGARYASAGEAAAGEGSRTRGVAGFWFAYGCNVFAGLMAIGHAAEIMAQSANEPGLTFLGALLIGLGNTAGGIAVALPRVAALSRYLLLVFPAMTAASLLVLALVPFPLVTLACLTIVGFAYGASIAVYPAVVNQVFGVAGPAVYGTVFTAWGMAGLAGPWLAGMLFSLSGNYRLSLLVAALLAMASFGFASRLRFAMVSR